MRILVVEDEPKLLEMLRQGLTEEGFSVDAAADGEDALFQAEHEAHDAIVLDLMLPKIPGLVVLERLRRAGRSTPVLILTARDGTPEKVAGLNAGADDYLTKPFTFTELVARLKALIRRTHHRAVPVLKIADLTIDTVARIVTRAGRPIALRAKEYALLELLALRQGEVVTLTHIYDHIYDGESDTLSNVVQVHISRLRGKIDRGFRPPLLQTVRGQGYRLKAP